MNHINAYAHSPRNDCATHVSSRANCTNCRIELSLRLAPESVRTVAPNGFTHGFPQARTDNQQALIAHAVVHRVFVGLYSTPTTDAKYRGR